MFKIDEITLIRVIYLDDLSSGNKSCPPGNLFIL